MADDTFGDNQGGANVTYNPSTYKFTDPIRYFKANDPYYWEVDNIPLKQVQENILWLKDQVGQMGGDGGGDTSTGEVGRAEFTELRPFAGNGMQVGVNSGNFMGRVNDAYNTGISKLIVDAKTNYGDSIFDTQKFINLNDSVLFALVGQTTTNILNNNGLYDHLQTHAANYQGDNIEYEPGYTFDKKNIAVGVYDIPKLKLALWQQDKTTKTWLDPTDLQQLAVEFTRAWGAPFRTALVNVENQLDIIIPKFDGDSDYPIEDTNFIPTVRVDLLFIYTVPVDASVTTIAKAKDKNNPQTLTKPALGIVKGAGVVKLKAESRTGSPWSGDKVNSPFIQGNKYQNNKTTVGNYLQRDNNESRDSYGNTQITSPIGDHNKNIGTAGVFTNFPSPDDLMNLAPYLADELQGSKSFPLIGQSVLPIAYIFVERGAISLTNDNILDIRPFFRTAELTYNERAGIAASNPPASLANPFVTNSDIVRRLSKLYALIKTLPWVDDGWDLGNPPPPPFVAEASLGLVAAGGFEQDNARGQGIGYIGGDQLNIASNDKVGSDTTKVRFTTPMKDTNYVVRCRSITKWSHRMDSGNSKYNTVYVTPDRTVDYFVLEHQSPSGANSTELFVTYEVYEYNYIE